ncbi:MAG TPA: HEAT repeat domain-containing protein [Ktedonobacteraceae bacterium]|nr:HEAT repeat domain-containing protein [Ktedonobacteraceae bacterium]
MRNEHNNTDQSFASMPDKAPFTVPHLYHLGSRESTLAALALLLGPETEGAIRKRAAHKLANQGLTSLPLILTTLNQYPEITTPSWPLWPPQFEPCSYLLARLCQQAHYSLETLLQHPVLTQPVGPVLWISVIEATHLLPSRDHETLIREGLTAAWATVRYAAAIALVNLAGTFSLDEITLQALQMCTGETETIPVRLTSAFALMRMNNDRGLPALMRLLESNIPEEARKAGIFLLATDPPRHLTSKQQERLTALLLAALQDANGEIALHAAHALHTIALPSILPPLCSLLNIPRPQLQIAALTTIEELANRTPLRRAFLQSTLPSHINTLLRSEIAEVRRQASYTLAVCGGVYATAALGTTLLDQRHPGHKEATEAIRLLRNALHASTRTRVSSWLLQVLHHAQTSCQNNEKEQEELQITALDSLAFLAWQAQKRSRKQVLLDISSEVFRTDLPLQLLSSQSAWVRQRTIELLGLLVQYPQPVLSQLLHMLRQDKDSGVRACCAYTLGQLAERSAIPDLLHTLLDVDISVAETALHTLGRLATPEDSIVVAIMRELALYSYPTIQKKDRLAWIAQKQLKRWGIDRAI